MTDALDAAEWDPERHPRVPEGAPGGGEFVSIGADIRRLVRDYSTSTKASDFRVGDRIVAGGYSSGEERKGRVVGFDSSGGVIFKSGNTRSVRGARFVKHDLGVAPVKKVAPRAPAPTPPAATPAPTYAPLGGEPEGGRRWAARLPDRLINSLASYKGTGYSQINNYLRGSGGLGGNDPADIQRKVDDIDAAIQTSPGADRNLTVYRVGRLPAGLRAGDTLADAAFLSTSTGEANLKLWDDPDSQRFQIQVPQGTEYADMEAADYEAKSRAPGLRKLPARPSWSTTEQELLFARGTQLQVISEGPPMTLRIVGNQARQLGSVRMAEGEVDDPGRFTWRPEDVTVTPASARARPPRADLQKAATLHLHYRQGYGVRESARILGLPHSTVHDWIRQGPVVIRNPRLRQVAQVAQVAHLARNPPAIARAFGELAAAIIDHDPELAARVFPGEEDDEEAEPLRAAEPEPEPSVADNPQPPPPPPQPEAQEPPTPPPPLLDQLGAEAWHRFMNLLLNDVPAHRAVTACQHIDPDFDPSQSQIARAFYALGKGSGPHLLAEGEPEPFSECDDILLLANWSAGHVAPPQYVLNLYDEYEMAASDIATLSLQLRDMAEEAYREGINAQLSALGLGPVPAITDPQVLHRITVDAQKTAETIAGTYNKDLGGAVYEAWIDGLATRGRQMSSYHLDNAVNKWAEHRIGWKTNQIADTESTKWYNRAVQDFAERNYPALPQIQYYLTPDQCACAACCELVANNPYTAAQAAAIPIPLHPNCALEGSLAQPLGVVLAGSRAAYSGPVVRIATGHGSRLGLTPNHPVLTARGWIAAQALCQGDDVLRIFRPDSPMSGTADDGGTSDVHFDHVPSSIEEIYEALRARGHLARAVGTATDFHGDGERIKGKIDVVLSDRALAGVADAPGIEQPHEHTLVTTGGRREGLPSLSPPPQLVHRPLHAPYGSMGGLSASRVVAAIPEDDPSLLEAVADALRAHPDFLGDEATSQPLCVERDTVVNVNVEPSWHGTVYDLQTSEGMYAVDGIVTHNCVHAWIPVAEGAASGKLWSAQDYEGGQISASELGNGIFQPPAVMLEMAASVRHAVHGSRHGGSAQTLRDYWANRPTKHGKVSGITWGIPGDFYECVARVSKFMPPDQAKGYCALRHHQATGAWPGHAPAEQAAKAAGRALHGKALEKVGEERAVKSAARAEQAHAEEVPGWARPFGLAEWSPELHPRGPGGKFVRKVGSGELKDFLKGDHVLLAPPGGDLSLAIPGTVVDKEEGLVQLRATSGVRPGERFAAPPGSLVHDLPGLRKEAVEAKYAPYLAEWRPELHPRGPGGLFTSVGSLASFLTKARSQPSTKVARLRDAKILAAPKPTVADIARNRELIRRSGRAGGELRGNSRDRASRTRSLLDEFGDGTTCECVWCGQTLDAHTLTQDKIYTAGEGGRYRMANLLPACLHCNQVRNDTSLFAAEVGVSDGAVVRAQVYGWHRAQSNNLLDFPDPALPVLDMPQYVQGALQRTHVEIPWGGYDKYSVDGIEVDPGTVQELHAEATESALTFFDPHEARIPKGTPGLGGRWISVGGIAGIVHHVLSDEKKDFENPNVGDTFEYNGPIVKMEGRITRVTPDGRVFAKSRWNVGGVTKEMPEGYAGKVKGSAPWVHPGSVSLTPDEAAYRNGYLDATGNDFINGALRAGRPSAAAPYLDSAIGKGTFLEPTTVYRGMSLKTLPKVGQTITDKAYMSTTLDQAMARRFANMRSGQGEIGNLAQSKVYAGQPAVLKINLPAGQHAMAGDETVSEYVLPRNLRIRIVSQEPDGTLVGEPA